MIWNNAADVQAGQIPADAVYAGSFLVWQRGEPVSPYDKYEEDYSDDILLVLLDANGNETNTIQAFPIGSWVEAQTWDSYYGHPLYKAFDWLKQQPKSNRYNLYFGDSVTIPAIAFSFYTHLWDAYIESYVKSNYDQVQLFRYPRKWGKKDGVYGLSYSTKGLANLKTVILPETNGYGESDVRPVSRFLAGSGVSEVVFRSDYARLDNVEMFRNCLNLKKIDIPQVIGSISSTAFYGCDGITINLTGNSPGSISGSPWGATNATVNWLG